MKKARDEMGLTNIKLMVPFCRTVEEGRRVLAEMASNGLRRGDGGLEVYVMCEIPSNVILADQFAEVFDGFSIGSNDLTQLVLGVDRDSEIVAPIFDERNPAVMTMIADVIDRAQAAGRKIGICGQAPSDYPEFARFLVERRIDSISLNPDAVLRTTVGILDVERSSSSRPDFPKARASRMGDIAMSDDIFIDDDGRFQMPSDELAGLVAHLRENHVPCDMEDAGALRLGGRPYGYARVKHLYDLEIARRLCHAWRPGAGE
jgi:hypothetical protein